MFVRTITTLALVSGLAVVPACTINGGGDDETTANPTTGGSENPTTTTPTPTEPMTDGTDGTVGTDGTDGTTLATDGTTDPTGGAADGPICVNFGGYDGVKAVIASFVGKVLVDERINAYFLNTATLADGGANFVACLEKQVGAAIGCAGVTYDCMDMKTAHAGMGISTNDFTDLAEDFGAAMDEVATITAENKMTVIGVLSDMGPDIIEDADSDATTYQVVGRKPGLNTVIGGTEDPQSFIALVAADMTLIGFFDPAGLPRLKTCLVRQVTDATAGGSALGEIYGKEVTAPEPVEPGVTADNPCKDMKSSHENLVDKGDMMGIQYEDFSALVGHLQTAMDNKGVGMTEQNAILGALGPLCPDIVTVDPAMCP